MAEFLYWVDGYVEKKRDAESAIRLIRSGQRVFIGSACGEPQELVRRLAEYANYFSGLEIVRMMSQESAPLIEIAGKTAEAGFSIRNIYLGAASSAHFQDNLRFVTPMNISDVPSLFKSRNG
jgi:acyl-CoA hydrolase